MNEAQAFFSQPGVGFFTLLLIGAIAGWIAERVTSSNHGIFTNILVGIAGSFIGAKLAEIAQVPVFGFWRTLISAAIGAIIILFAWRTLRRR
ncbi:MAG TPA: GlsB/YeaQ/YmgE family stress response membrane protein [Afipia sp.]